jgi:hypothetical protein
VLDWITPKLFITGEGHERHVLLSQFMLMLPDYHFKGTPTTGGRSSSTFTDILDQMLSVIAAAGQHRAFEELPFQAQATALVAWWKRTRCFRHNKRARLRAQPGVVQQHSMCHCLLQKKTGFNPCSKCKKMNYLFNYTLSIGNTATFA